MDADNLTKVPKGLSFTMNEYLRQYSTAIANLWGGSIYRKLLDYLLRILLRLHLAPTREANYRSQTERHMKAAEEKKKMQEEQSKSMTRKLWRSKVAGLLDELSDVIEMNGKLKRIPPIFSRLIQLHQNEPKKRYENISSLETRA
ncbi:hypothetical protein BGZ49_006422, partial [Haplosporangium sp. Z 27]